LIEQALIFLMAQCAPNDPDPRVCQRRLTQSLGISGRDTKVAALDDELGGKGRGQRLPESVEGSEDGTSPTVDPDDPRAGRKLRNCARSLLLAARAKAVTEGETLSAIGPATMASAG
jgi:hypothetical protein